MITSSCSREPVIRATAPPEQSARPADAPGDEEFTDGAGLLAGRDYETDLMTLQSTDSDATVPEPALR